MPNGIDKNWYRLCAAIDSFRMRYGSWPTRIRTFEDALEKLFTENSFARLKEKLDFVYDGSPFIAEDDQGNSHNYGKEGFIKGQPDVSAREWLGVEPDSQMVKNYYGR